MLNSKQLIELTGISRATLNNYVALGILPNPVVKTPVEEGGRATRLGYFEDDAIDCIRQVQALKKDGFSMAQIAQKLGGHSPAHTAATNKQFSSAGEQGSLTSLSSLTVDETIDSFPGPAYMVNNNFELIWWNEKAGSSFFGSNNGLPGDLESRNLLKLLFEAQPAESEDDLKDILRPHMAAAKKRLSQQSLIKVYSAVNPDKLAVLKELYEEVEAIGKEAVIHFPALLPAEHSEPEMFDLYVCFYREGILFTYSPVLLADDYLLEFLGKRNHVINELLRKRKPYLTNVAVMVADLQDSTRICSELPAEEYFELINDIWQQSEPIFRRYYGTYGKHAGDGMVYYFFPQPDCDYKLNAIRCSLELQQMMKGITQRWQIRKGWFSDLQLNIGINGGQEWFGSFHASGHVEFTVLGETINNASRVSEFAHNGTIWTTKSMLNQIPAELRRNIVFGISRKTQHGDSVFVADTYASLGSLINEDHHGKKFRSVQNLPITELRDYEEGKI